MMERRLKTYRVGGVEVAKLFTERRAGPTSKAYPASKASLQGKLKSKQEKALRDF